MLPTFVIGLREGLEAALIVGIIAAFLRKQGRRDLVRWVFVGVGIAVLLCLGVGVALKVLSSDLPQKKQEGLETIVGALAVLMVTYMVIWMKRHSRELKGQLEGLAADAMNGRAGSGRAMVFMAFLAVLREGFETVVFLLAAFNESGGNAGAGFGAVLGIVVAVILGYGIYRGGVRLNLSKFFRATGLVLVLVAAGLVVNALHTAHEAGWLNSGQGLTVDLTALVRPGSVQSSLLTGMLGVQPHPVTIEIIGWLLYLLPVGIFVAWPPGRGLSRRTQRVALLATAIVAAVAALALALATPARPGLDPRTLTATGTAQAVSRAGRIATVRTEVVSPAAPGAAHAAADLRFIRTGAGVRGGIPTVVYAATVAGDGALAQPARLGFERIAELNGGRLPIGVNTQDGASDAAVRYTDTDRATVWIEPRTGRIVDLRWSEQITAQVQSAVGEIPLARPVGTAASSLSRVAVAAAATGARADLATLDRRSALRPAVWICAVVALLALGCAGAMMLADRRRRPLVPAADPAVELVKS